MARRPPGQRDYSDLKRNGESQSGDVLPDNSARRWWAADGKELAAGISSTVEFLQRVQAPRLRQHIISARLYGNIAMMGPGASAYARLATSQSAQKDRITYNAIQSIIDTLTSRIGETKPRPYYLTSGGSFAQQRKAKKLNQFTEGVFYETKAYDKGLDCFRDGAIWGDGFMGVFRRGGKLHHERVLGSELWVDEVEAMYGHPRNMYRVKDVDREVLLAEYPDAKKAILAAGRVVEDMRGENVSDMVRVIEAWHLPALSPKGELSGGLNAVVLANQGTGDGILVEPEEWPYDFFPFARFPWCRRPVGFWSQGLCEQLQGEQLELNKELWFIQRSMQLAGTIKVLLKNGSKVSKEHLTNDVGAVITYTGDVPQFYCPEPIHPVFFENVNRIIERMYRQAGASELASSSKKPAGLNSGKALREFEDIESERHRTTSRLNDNFYLEQAMLDLRMAKGLSGYKVKVPGRHAFNVIDVAKDIGDVDEDSFVRQCFPVSRLPRDPAGRLQTIQEYMQAGMMTQRQGRRALDFPDLEQVESLANAQEDILTKVLDDILDEGKYRPPEPTDDLPLAKEMCLEYIQRYRQFDDAEYEKLDLLRRFNSQCDTLMKKAMGPGVAAGMPPGGAPQAAPAAPPVSDLLPNAPKQAA